MLCCGHLPTWNPPIFGGSVYPVGLIDEQSGVATPDFFELQESLPIIRASTWDQEAIKKKREEERRKKRKEGERKEREGEGEDGVVGVQDDDVVFQERRKTSTDDDLKEVRERLQVCCTCIHTFTLFCQYYAKFILSYGCMIILYRIILYFVYQSKYSFSYSGWKS